ncbi:MAG: discoidin domain-containing protein, partial [Ginsengibacter sp.]
MKLLNIFKKIIYGSAVCLLIVGNCRAQVAGSPSSLPDIKFHLTARPWQPINLNKNEYLDKVEGIVRQIAKYQNSSGAIVDPYSYSEVQYSTPYFAYALGALINSGRAADLLNKGIYAMEHATLDFSHGADSIPDDHGEFYLAPLAGAMAFYTPYISSAQLKSWQTRLSTPLAKIARGRTHNWRTYAMKGEWARAKNGYVNKDSAITWIEDSWINTQKPRFDNNQWKFYHDETSDPDSWTYEIAARGNLLAMIGDGYSGSSLADIYNILSLGARASLLTQDPSGQSPASGRTSNHTWNDIVQGNSFLTMADFENTKGNKRLAGQYRHAAALSFQSAQRWRQSNGLYSVTKNQFDPYERNGYATYSFLTNYNGTMMFHMAENYFKNSAIIVEEPAPNEIGGYTLTSDYTLATAFANAGGMEMEASLRGATDLLYSRYWSSLGVVRFARPGWDSRLGPSDGIRDDNNIGVSFAPTFLENGNWIRLASVPERYEAFFSTQFVHPLLVRCRIEYKPKVGQTGPTFTNDFTITPDLILSNLTSTTSSSNFGITWPILTFDGKTNLATNFSPNIARTAFNANSDEEAFIAVHPNPTINSSENVRRSVYGDLLPVRMVSNATNNLSLIYPRNSTDPSAESVRTSFSLSGTDFSSMLGSVNGNIYVGRTSAGGVGTSIDLDNDKVKDVTFSASCSFIMQLDKGVITNIETDKPVTATISGTPITLSAYTPYALPTTINQSAASVIASADDGNVPANTIDGDLNTRWSALGEQWIKYSFDSLFKLNSLKIAWYRGNERNYAFDVQASADGQNWGTIFTGKSAGITAGFETYAVSDTLARYVRFLVHGSNVNRWNAINEVLFSKQTKAFNTTGASILFSRTFDSVHVDQGGTGSLLEYISTTDNTPASVTLTAIDGSGNVPTWLSVNGSNLNSLLYTTGSEITFSFDATNLSVGNYSAVVTASAPGYKSGLDTISLTVDAPSTGSLANLQINFQDSVTVPPTGWLRDYGQSFGQRTSSYQGLGNVYGWIARSNNQPVDLRKNSRKRTTSSNILLATFMHMQANDAPSSSLTSIEGIWEAQVPNGNYDVTISVGDPSYNDSRHSINVEGVNAINGFIPSSSQQFKTATVTVSVSDGILTIDAVGGFNTKINYVKVKPSASQRPSIVLVNPENAATQVSENTSISTSILKLPNGGIDNNTIISSNVFLTEETSGALVPSNVNGTGGGDAITLVPSQPLK